MKNLKFAILIFLAISACLSCEKFTSDENEEFIHLTTEYEDCNISEKAERLTRSAASIETLTSYLNGDTLEIDVSMKYLCCAAFDSKSTFNNDTLRLEIMDMTSEFQKSHCRCNCTYGFRFYYKFGDFTALPVIIHFSSKDNPEEQEVYRGVIKKEGPVAMAEASF